MLKNSFKKLVASVSAVAMTAALFVPAASAVTLDHAAILDAVNVVEATTVSSTTTTDATKEIYFVDNAGKEYVATGEFTIKYDVTINEPVKNGQGTRDIDSFAIVFSNHKVSGGWAIGEYNEATNSYSMFWKNANINTIAGTMEVGKTYTHTYELKQVGTGEGATGTLVITDENGAQVAKHEGLNFRNMTDDSAGKGTGIQKVLIHMAAREEGKEASVSFSDFVLYTKTGADAINVTATGVKLSDAEDAEDADLPLEADDNEAIYIPSSGGSFGLTSVVMQAEDDVTDGYEVVYALEDAPNGVTIDGSTISVSAVADAGTLNPVLVVSTTADPTAKAKIELNLVKADASPQEYVDAFAETLTIQDLDGKDIKKTGNTYVFEKGFTVYPGDGVAKVEWSVYQETDDEDEPWEESDIISTKTGKYSPVENFDGKIKLVATVTHKDSSTAVATKEFICKVSDSEKEVAADLDYLETMIDWEDNVISDLDLPSYGPYGSTITWASSNPSVISTKGDVTRAAENKTVRLTATIEKGNESEEVTFTVTVTKKRSSGNGGGGSVSSTGGYISSSSIVGIVDVVEATPVPVATPKPVVEVTFTDLDSVEWAKTAITELAKRKVINGRTATEFAPNDDITRAEFAKILISAFGLVTPGSTVTGLSDVTDSSAWYYDSIASAYNKGIITGYADGTFGVNDKVTRQDMAVMVYRAAQTAGVTINVMAAEANFQDADQIGDYAKEAVTALQRAGIINGVSETEFAPTATATRAQAAKIIYGLIK